jgi:fatty-acyl-CoA synthase
MGSSEAGLVGGKERPPGSDGMLQMEPRPDLAVIDDELCIVTAPGSEGTLACTGYTPIGYYGDPKKSAETFITLSGRLWVLTGDRARIDVDGQYVILGRGSQCINSGGEKIYPEEVEEAARRYAAVGDVQVVGVPDERWGQKVAAVVQVAAGASFDRTEFDRICRNHLSGYKVPKVVCLVDQMQRSPAGKADYTWAKKVAAAQAGT